jgi:hypothetical protein
MRRGVSMDRRLGTAHSERLFSTETLPSFLLFQSTIDGDLDEDLEQILRNSARILTHFGAGGARGLGRCDYILAEDK